MRAARRTAVLAVSLLALAGPGLVGCGGGADPQAGAPTVVAPGAVGDGATAAPPPATAPASTPPSTPPTTPPPTPPTTPPPTTAPATTVPAAPTADRRAGVLSRTVPDSGDGAPVVVPGAAPAPGPGTDVVTVAVSVEGGLAADGAAFADFVLATLNDPRGWSEEGYTFARTDDVGAADVTVVLASPALTDRLCRPLVTYGRLSCRNGDRSVLTWYRWVEGIPEYADDLTAYRQYLVNHEVGHFLGKGHVSCPAPGALAPVMMQQTKGLAGCARNAWPYP